MTEFKWLGLLLLSAPSTEVWRQVGIVLLGVLLGGNFVLLQLLVKKVDDLDTRIVAVALKQAEAIGERKGQMKALEDRILLLEKQP